MHVHILGIGGTFMGGLAQLANALGHRVSGCDAGVYSPMREQLEQAGIAWQEGDEVVSATTEHPGCLVPLHNLRRRFGVRVNLGPSRRYVAAATLATGREDAARHAVRFGFGLVVALCIPPVARAGDLVEELENAFELVKPELEAAAEDAVSATLLAILEKPAAFQGASSLRTYATGILKFKIIQ